jgi:hypothetical protein
MYIGVCSKCCKPIHTGDAFKQVLLENGLQNQVRSYVYQHRGNCVKWSETVNLGDEPRSL